MVLMIYNDQICKEILMPNLYNTDYQIRLSATDYKLRSDIVLKLERGGGEWSLVSTKEYWITDKGERVNKHKIVKDDLISIDTANRDHLIIITSGDEICLRMMEKYDLRGVREVTIGRASANTVTYSFMTLISSSHAVLRKEGGSWILNDTSRNGIYYKNNRIHGKHVMRRGEPVEMFGLHIMVIGQILMVGANCGTLEVSDKLSRLAIEPYEPGMAVENEQKETTYFNRSPRNLPVLNTEEVEIDAPPPPVKQESKPAYMVIGPAFSMAIPMSVGCLITIIGSQISGRSSGVATHLNFHVPSRLFQ